jgi:hypothetical protein
MGMDAAMMVMADSAAARMTSWVVDSVKVVLEMEGSWVIFMMEVMPALGAAKYVEVSGRGLRVVVED